VTIRFIGNIDKDELEIVTTDVVVIGSGIAGLYTALQCAANARVTLICKEDMYESNTRYAQGGIAAVIADDDSPVFHVQDTLLAGAGLNSRLAVEALASEGPDAVKELIRLGMQFDREHGELALTREGAHSHRRILHANGDATGAEVVRALCAQVRNCAAIAALEHTYAIDLVCTRSGECSGVICQNRDGSYVFIRAKATVLASGGAGHMYRYTTNPAVATADGLGLAYRAGAELADMEFVQFHPTVLCYKDAPRFLISEAVRGEGALLRNVHGERFMPAYHELAELAPRDIVARAIVTEAEKTGSEFVYLDITHHPADELRRRFPNISDFCKRYDLDLTKDWIPVAPAAHYMMGGVRTGLYGETSVDRLYAVGEAACSGVHGANRLASNSLSEGLVFGKRISREVVSRLNEPFVYAPSPELFRRTGIGRGPTNADLRGLQRVWVEHVAFADRAKA